MDISELLAALPEDPHVGAVAEFSSVMRCYIGPGADRIALVDWR